MLITATISTAAASVLKETLTFDLSEYNIGDTVLFTYELDCRGKRVESIQFYMGYNSDELEYVNGSLLTPAFGRWCSYKRK